MKIRVTCQACQRKKVVAVEQGAQVQTVYFGDGRAISMDNIVEVTEDTECRCGATIAIKGELIRLVAPGRRFRPEWAQAAAFA